MEPWKADRILALAPDPASAKAGQGLSSPQKWVSLGQDEEALWGECLGSGASPYQTQIDLSEPAFKCTCPSRKFPCKHGLGLFLMLGPKIPAVDGTQPDWVKKWLATRKEKVQAKKEKLDKPAEIVDPAAQAKRAAERTRKVTAGIDEFMPWLFDLTRGGLANIPAGGNYFEQPRARLVDAQAPGVARWVGELEEIAHAGTQWHVRLLEEVSSLFLLTEAFRRIDSLPPENQADVRALLGFITREEDVLQGAPIRDTWQVLGQKSVDEDRLRVQRTWLCGVQTQRPALILTFAPMNQPVKSNLVAGMQWEADLVFHPSAFPLRALIKERTSDSTPIKTYRGYESIPAALNAYSEALGKQPWTNRFPLSLGRASVLHHGGKWLVRDEEGSALPLRPRFSRAWELLALGGGHPLEIFGEFDGKSFAPLSACSEGEFHDLA